jgi:hypothetical protein
MLWAAVLFESTVMYYSILSLESTGQLLLSLALHVLSVDDAVVDRRLRDCAAAHC